MSEKYRITTTSDDPQLHVRIPLELKKAVEARARLKGQSRNAEILAMLALVLELKIERYFCALI